ncbi:MAG: hypothetical protein COB84_02315 [Rhodobacteraceae bacterium]|nr:MAG: hypothetical protein COB84_02315 [Paracoccaceae bacterium]
MLGGIANMNSINTGRFHQFYAWLSKGVGALAGIALLIMMSVAFIGVIMRYFFNAPILGGNEIIQVLSGVTVMMAIPSAAALDSHIRVDVLDNFIGKVGRFIGDVLSRVLAIIVLSLLVQKAYAKIWDALKYEDTTNLLQIPIWPIYVVITAGMAIFVFILGVELAAIILPRKNSNV